MHPSTSRSLWPRMKSNKQWLASQAEVLRNIPEWKYKLNRTLGCVYIIIYLGPQKRIFFCHTASTIFLGHYGDAFCTGKCGHICFFFNISVRLFFNKMLKNYGFAMPLASEPRPYMAIFAHIWPYMTHFFGHPESTASIRFDHFFWSLRVIVVIDEIFLCFTWFGQNDWKKHVYAVTGNYI